MHRYFYISYYRHHFRLLLVHSHTSMHTPRHFHPKTRAERNYGTPDEVKVVKNWLSGIWKWLDTMRKDSLMVELELSMSLFRHVIVLLQDQDIGGGVSYKQREKRAYIAEVVLNKLHFMSMRCW